VEVGLRPQLREEEDTEHLVSLSLLVRCQSLSEDVAQPPQAFREVVVGACEVEEAQVNGEDVVRIRERIEVL